MRLDVRVRPNMRIPTAVALLTLSFALVSAPACDSAKEGGGKAEGDAKKDDAKKDDAGSELAKKLTAEIAEMKGELAKGEDIKYGCAGNLGQYKDLATSSKADEKAAWAALSTLCHVDMPNKFIAVLREKMAKGELGSMDMVNLSTTIEDEDFPKEGEPAKVAAEAKKVLEIEVPTSELNGHLAAAAKEKQEGKTVSMACIKAKQVVDKSRAALEGDDKGKAALAAFAEACPQK